MRLWPAKRADSGLLREQVLMLVARDRPNVLIILGYPSMADLYNPGMSNLCNPWTVALYNPGTAEFTSSGWGGT